MLDISRSDVCADSITSFPVGSRFIKLPIENYLKLLPVEGGSAFDMINRPQVALINAVNNPKYRFICAALARRLGKTFIANVIAQLVLLVPGCNILIISPNYNLSSISFDLQRGFINKFGVEIVRDNRKDKILEISNGSSVRMGSLSTVDSCVGRSYDLIIFDEAALGEGGKEAFNVSLRPTLDKLNSKAIFISTPRGKNNWFAEFFSRGYSPAFPEWCSIKADYRENTRMSLSDVEEAKRSMSRAEFEQEYMANFNVYEGIIYEVPQSSIIEYTQEEGDDFIAGLDPGYRDPTALITIAYRPSTDVFHIIGEYYASERNTKQHVEFMRPILERGGIDTVYVDSAAAQFASDLASIYDINTIKAKKDVLPGIAYVQTLFQTNRLLIDPSCTQTLAELDQYQWDTSEGQKREKPVHLHSHIPDAIRYALYTYTL